MQSQYLSNGVAVVTIAILVIVLLIVVIAYVKTKWPNSPIVKDARTATADADAVWNKYREATSAAIKRVEPTVKADVAGVEKYIGDAFDKWLIAAEEKLTDTSAEESDIAEATQTLADANASKAARIARINAHVDKLQKFSAALQATLPTPTAGS